MPNPAETLARDCLAVRVRLLARRVTAIYDEALRPLGIKTSQLNVLTAIGVRGPCAGSEIARLLDLEKSTLSRNLDRLRLRRWIRSEPGADGRSQLLSLTGSGRKLLERALPLWRSAQRDARKALGSEAAGALHDIGSDVLAANAAG